MSTLRQPLLHTLCAAGLLMSASCKETAPGGPDGSDLSGQEPAADMTAPPGSDLRGQPDLAGDGPRGTLLLFTVTPPRGSTAGALDVSVGGLGFVDGPGLALSFGGTAATQVKLVSSAEISARVPARPGALGPVDVTLTSGDGQMTTGKGIFTYYLNSVSFAAHAAYGAATGARSVVTGDFNGDRKPDVASANADSNSVSVLLGNGDGTFQVPRTAAVGTYPFSIASGDLNGDGMLDVVTANQQSANVTVLLGNGDGTFQAPRTFATAAGPQGVAIADLTVTGRMDIVVGNYGDSSYSVLVNGGGGSFTVTTTKITRKPYGILVEDLNGDGAPDLVTLNSDTADIGAFQGDRAGAFKAPVLYPAGAAPFAGVISDLDRDGYPELVVANATANTISVLQGRNQGTFEGATPLAVGARPEFVTAGDFDGDGKPDLAVAHLNSNNVYVLMGKGDRTFDRVQMLGVGSKPNSLAITALTGSGKSDILVSNYGDGKVGVLLNSSQ